MLQCCPRTPGKYSFSGILALAPWTMRLDQSLMWLHFTRNQGKQSFCQTYLGSLVNCTTYRINYPCCYWIAKEPRQVQLSNSLDKETTFQSLIWLDCTRNQGKLIFEHIYLVSMVTYTTNSIFLCCSIPRNRGTCFSKL